MDSQAARARAELSDEISKWTVGWGVVGMALFPFALPIVVLTAVALLPLLVPLLALGLLAGVVTLPIIVIRKLVRSATRLTRPHGRRGPGETSSRPATGH
jgi:hypothetical protein